MRVARRALVLVEPIYELASAEAQERMSFHGYVRGLKETVEKLGGDVVEYRLLDFVSNTLNPSGVIRVAMPGASGGEGGRSPDTSPWRCPLTHTGLVDLGDAFVSPDAGLAYPVLRGIPLLRSEHSIVASALREASDPAET
jgi:uncharacterized protein YbaR (Trm112 family)